MPPLARLAVPVALVCDPGEAAVGAAAGLARGGLDGLILPPERVTPAVAALLGARGYAIQWPDGRIQPPGAGGPGREAGRISLLTSGTTGVPKLIHHRWDSLFTLRHARAPLPHRWLLTYQTGTYAWFQMVTMALFAPGQEMVAGARLEPGPLLELARLRSASAISSTPTFWRFALLQTDPALLRAQSFAQVSLGGERVDQVILDRLRGLFPSARISHIYASTEVGAAIVVNDGHEGFPATWLDSEASPAEAGAVQLRVRDDRLWVRSPHASLDHRGWVDTGDQVELRGGRVVIVGRADSSFVNVGGLKVSTHSVEEALLQHEDVAWCRVYARSSVLVGSLVAADVVLRNPPADRLEAETKLTRHAERFLAAHAVPRIWRLLDSIPMTGSLKSEVP